MMTMTDGLVPAVRAATGRPDAVVADSASAPLCQVTNATTQALTLHWGTLDDGSPWKVVAKTFRPLEDSPIWALIPDHFRTAAAEALDWQAERRVLASGVAERLPAGVTMPRVWHIEEEGRRLTIWMEAVDDRPEWDLDRYRRAARSLGRMAGALGADEAERLGIRPRPLDSLFYGRVTERDLPMIGADWFWDNDILREVEAELRGRLIELGRRGPELLARLHELPVGLSHGDAAPANLLETEDDTLVLIDCGYMHIGQMGGDLAQLLSGRALEGRAGAPLDVIAASIIDHFLEGSEGRAGVDRATVETALAVHLAMRALFDGLIIEGPPTAVTAEALAPRIELVRFGLDFVERALPVS